MIAFPSLSSYYRRLIDYRMPAADEDFLSSMFSQEQPAGSMPSTEDFYGSQPAFSNPQNTQEMMENMMALHPPAARQTLLESQLKIQQLQQLQQLQQQIFQQQVLNATTFCGMISD